MGSSVVEEGGFGKRRNRRESACEAWWLQDNRETVWRVSEWRAGFVVNLSSLAVVLVLGFSSLLERLLLWRLLTGHVRGDGNQLNTYVPWGSTSTVILKTGKTKERDTRRIAQGDDRTWGSDKKQIHYFMKKIELNEEKSWRSHKAMPVVERPPSGSPCKRVWKILWSDAHCRATQVINYNKYREQMLVLYNEKMCISRCVFSAMATYIRENG